VLALMDAVNKTLLDLLTTSEFAAFPLRYAIGVTLDSENDAPPDDGGVEETDSIGRPVRSQAPIISAMNRWLKLEDPDAKIGQLEAAALEPYTKAIDAFVELTGTVTGTRYHLLLNGSRSVPMTGEARKTAEKPLEGKVERKSVDFGEGLGGGHAAGVPDERRHGTGLHRLGGPLASRRRRQRDPAHRRPLEAGRDGRRPRDDPRARAVQPGADRPDDGPHEGLGRDRARCPLTQANVYGTLVRSGATPESAAAKAGAGPIEDRGLLPVTVQKPTA